MLDKQCTNAEPFFKQLEGSHDYDVISQKAHSVFFKFQELFSISNITECTVKKV